MSQWEERHEASYLSVYGMFSCPHAGRQGATCAAGIICDESV